MEIVPNLHFHGECEAAIELYEQAFGAQRTVFLRYQDADPRDFDLEGNQAYQEYVYHAEMRIGGQRIMLTDHTQALAEGRNLSLLISFDQKADVLAAYEHLKIGAQILAPLTETTYSGCFVSLIDRYGIRWELMVEN